MLIGRALSSILPISSSHLNPRDNNARNPALPQKSQYHIIEQLEPSFPARYQTQRIKVSYPAVRVPPMTENDGMAFFNELPTYMPCHNCLIQEMSSDIEYEDGTPANVSTGMWLHHAVFVNGGRKDTFCGEKSWGQRFYAVGNEKTTVAMSTRRDDIAGYFVDQHDPIAMSVDLMNMAHHEQSIVFSTTYEFVPQLPESYSEVVPLWLDVGGCKGSEVPAKPDSQFEFSSPSWTSDMSGRVIFAGGHLHDGGTKLQIFKNDDLVCEPQPTYQKPASQTGHDNQEHVFNISWCSNVAKTKPGDEWTIKAFYDTSLHPPMERMDGSLEPVMGISLVYIEQSQKSTSDLRPHCNWWVRSNIIPLTICVALVTGLIAFWGYQNRQMLREGQIRLVTKPIGRMPWWVDQELKLPVLSYRSNP